MSPHEFLTKNRDALLNSREIRSRVEKYLTLLINKQCRQSMQYQWGHPDDPIKYGNIDVPLRENGNKLLVYPQPIVIDGTTDELLLRELKLIQFGVEKVACLPTGAFSEILDIIDKKI